MGNENKGIGLVGLQIENIGPLKQIRVAIAKGVNVFQGDNGAGKSSILKSIEYALKGKKAIPADVIRHGFTEDGKSFVGAVTVETTAFEVQLTVKKDAITGEQKEKLEVKQNGHAIKNAPTFLSVFSKEWNDPQALANSAADKLYTMIMQYAKVDLSTYDKKIASGKEDLQVMRRMKKELGVKEPVGKIEALDAQKIIDEIAKIDDLLNLQKSMDSWKKEISDIQKKIDEARIKQIEILKEISYAPSIELREQKASQLKTITRTNEKAQEYKDFTTWKTKVDKIDSDFTEKETAVKLIEQEKDAAAKAAPMPADGLTISPTGEVLYNGALWDNCSESDRLLIGAQIIVNSTPANAVRYMVIHSGESILSERRERLHKFLIEHDYTCLMQVASEIPPNEGEGIFYIVEGEIKK